MKNPQWQEEFDELYNSFQLCAEIRKTDYDRLRQFIYQVYAQGELDGFERAKKIALDIFNS